MAAIVDKIRLGKVSIKDAAKIYNIPIDDLEARMSESIYLFKYI